MLSKAAMLELSVFKVVCAAAKFALVITAADWRTTILLLRGVKLACTVVTLEAVTTWDDWVVRMFELRVESPA